MQNSHILVTRFLQSLLCPGSGASGRTADSHTSGQGAAGLSLETLASIRLCRRLILGQVLPFCAPLSGPTSVFSLLQEQCRFSPLCVHPTSKCQMLRDRNNVERAGCAMVMGSRVRVGLSPSCCPPSRLQKCLLPVKDPCWCSQFLVEYRGHCTAPEGSSNPQPLSGVHMPCTCQAWWLAPWPACFRSVLTSHLLQRDLGRWWLKFQTSAPRPVPGVGPRNPRTAGSVRTAM